MNLHTKKTNAARLLDELGILYEMYEVSVDESDLSSVTLAHTLGVDPATVYKTLVAKGDKHGVLMTCIPSIAEVDLKSLAKASGNKSVSMVPLKEVFPLTGYIRGGCSPLAAKKGYPVYIDESILLHEKIYVSAGQRGVMLHLTPVDLIAATHALYAALTR